MSGSSKDGVEHRAGESPGKGILLARVIGAEQQHTPGHVMRRSMCKYGSRRGHCQSFRPAGFKILVKGDFPQRNDDTGVPEEPNFIAQESATALKLVRGRFISRRRAAHGRANVTIRQYETVITMGRRSLIGKSMVVQRFIEPIPTSITREYPSRSVPAMGRGSKPQNIESSVAVAKTRDWSSPIGPGHELAPFSFRDHAPIGDKPLTVRTGGNRVIENGQGSHKKMSQCSTNENVIPLAGGTICC